MTREKKDRIEHWLNHYTNNGRNPIDGTTVTGILKQALGYTYNAPSMSEDIADIALVYAQQQVKSVDLDSVGERFATETAIRFKRENGRYIDSCGNEITTEMVLKHPHFIHDDFGVIFL